MWIKSAWISYSLLTDQAASIQQILKVASTLSRRWLMNLEQKMEKIWKVLLSITLLATLLHVFKIFDFFLWLKNNSIRKLLYMFNAPVNFMLRKMRRLRPSEKEQKRVIWKTCARKMVITDCVEDSKIFCNISAVKIYWTFLNWMFPFKLIVGHTETPSSGNIQFKWRS